MFNGLDSDPGTLCQVLDNFETHLSADGLAVDPRSHRVFVAYGNIFARPRIAVFSLKP
jgi:hypothetical protein